MKNGLDNLEQDIELYAALGDPEKYKDWLAWWGGAFTFKKREKGVFSYEAACDFLRARMEHAIGTATYVYGSLYDYGDNVRRVGLPGGDPARTFDAGISWIERQISPNVPVDLRSHEFRMRAISSSDAIHVTFTPLPRTYILGPPNAGKEFNACYDVAIRLRGVRLLGMVAHPSLA